MEHLEPLETEAVQVPEPERISGRKRQGNKKRKWREIEALQERYRLQKELESIDIAYHASDIELKT